MSSHKTLWPRKEGERNIILGIEHLGSDLMSQCSDMAVHADVLAYRIYLVGVFC